MQEIKKYFELLQDLGEIVPDHNIRPSMQVPVIVIKQGKKYLGFVRWGLIPFWAKDDKIGYKLFNARAETIDIKPSFKKSFQSRRCLIPANGFYEWKKPEKTKYYCQIKDRPLFNFAGIWESWKNPQGEIVPSCTIITCEPNAALAPIHDRMPVILKKNDEDSWLHETDPAILKKLLSPYPPEEMIIKNIPSKES